MYIYMWSALASSKRPISQEDVIVAPAARTIDLLLKKRIIHLFHADGGEPLMSGENLDLRIQNEQSAPDGIEEVRRTAQGEIRPSNGTPEQGIPGEQPLGLRQQDADAAGGMPRGVDDL